MPSKALGKVIGLAALSLSVLLSSCGREPEGTTESAAEPIAPPVPAESLDVPPSSAMPILSAMESLESAADAKCDSTANRFEDFVFGTPLDEGAREEKVRLQKELVAGIWSRASAAALEADAQTVSQAMLQPWIDEVVRSGAAGEGMIRVVPRGADPIEISEVRLRQYSSIAYSLRALLGVQQDFMLDGGAFLATLESEGIDALCRALDLLTLAALKTADERARLDSAAAIDAGRIREAWAAVVPELPESAAATTVAGIEEASGVPGLSVLQELIREKLRAYHNYNELGKINSEHMLLANAERFYARYPISRIEKENQEILTAYTGVLDRFVERLLAEAQRSAEANGHRIIRVDDARSAVKSVIPAEIDVFEDVLVFPALEQPDRITLESYDCDAFRDLGLHWHYLGRAYGEVSPERMAIDPFAAEIITEGISQYGILSFRVAGQVAKDNHKSPGLLPQDLKDGENRILELVRRHEKAAPRVESSTRIVSTSSDVRRGEGRFFDDVTAGTGVDFVHRTSRWLSEWRRSRLTGAPTFSGGGVAAEDVDGDGDPDLLFVGGIGNALYINDGAGRFRDVTETAGIRYLRPDGSAGEARQPIIADLDNDGRQDLLITYANDRHRLYRGLGDGRFGDVTERAALGGEGSIGGPATVFDFDGDGLLDVYITYFGDYVSGALPTHERNNQNALPNRLFRNLGEMRFEDVTEGSGAADTGWSQGVSHTDFDRDGLQDIIVANDFGRNAYLRNLGGGRFENVAVELGLTKSYHSMNVGIADLNLDDFPDIYISNIAMMTKDTKYVLPDLGKPLNFDREAMGSMLVKESNMLYMSEVEQGRLKGYNPSDEVERGPTSTGWAWDAEFFDFDHDGDDDLYVVNGWNDYNFGTRFHEGEANGETAYYLLNRDREYNVFFVNQNGKLENLSEQSGADFAGNSRSTAYLDFDADGDLDIAVNNFQSPATMLNNNTDGRGGNWLKVRLEGDPRRGTNRDAIGARMVVTNGAGLTVHREVQGGSGYMSMNPKQRHFGVGASNAVRLEIVWPNGERQTVENLAVNRSYLIRQGTTEAAMLSVPATTGGQY